MISRSLGRLLGGFVFGCLALMIGMTSASFAGDAKSGPVLLGPHGLVVIVKPGQIADAQTATLMDLLSRIASALPETGECNCADKVAVLPDEGGELPQIARSGCSASTEQIAQLLTLLLERRAEGTIDGPVLAAGPIITWAALPEEDIFI